MAQRHFTRGAAVFTCQTCGHRSRGTTQDSTRTDMCGPCQDLSGLQNSLWDDGFDNFKGWGEAERARLIKGMDAARLARVKARFPDLFAAGGAK